MNFSFLNAISKVRNWLSRILLLCLLITGSNSVFSAAISSSSTGNWSASAWPTTNRTGTVTCTTASPTLTGSGTSFTTEFSVGNILSTQGGVAIGTILSIESNTSLTLNANASNNVTAQTFRGQGVGSGDAVTIASGHTVTIDKSIVACNTLTIAILATTTTVALNLNGNRLNVTGNITMNSPSAGTNTSSITIGTGYLYVGGSISMNAVSTSRICEITISTGTLEVVTDIASTSTSSGNKLTCSDAATIKVGGAFFAATPANVTWTQSTSTVEFTGANPDPGTFTFYNLTFSGSGSRTLATGITISNNFSISGVSVTQGSAHMTIGGNFTLSSTGTFTTAGSTNNFTVSGSSSISGTFVCKSTGNRTFTGGITINNGGIFEINTTLPTSFNWGTGLTYNAGGTLKYNSLNSAIVATTEWPATNSPTNVILSTSSASYTVTIPGNRTIPSGGTLTLTSGYLAVGSNTITIDGTAVLGTNLITGAGGTTISSGATVKTANTSGLSTTAATGSIQTTTISYNSGANYEFNNATTNQVTGNFLSSTTPTANQINNLTINNGGTSVTLSASVNVAGVLALTDATLIVGANTLTISGSSPTQSAGDIDASNASASVVFTNTSSITLPSTFFKAATNVQAITMFGIGGVALGQAITIAGTLTLTSGILSTSSTISVTNTATSAISGASSSSYVSGPLKWTMAVATGTSGSTYLFPVGKGGNYYPFTMSKCTNAASQAPTVEAFATAPSGTLNGTLSGGAIGGEYWKVIYSANAITAEKIKLERPTTIGTLNNVAYSTASTGAWTALGGNATSSYALETTSYESGDLTGATRYYCMATNSCSLTSPLTVGHTGDNYTTITAALNAIKACGFTGNMVIEIQSDYTPVADLESYPITFDGYLGTSASKTITLRLNSSVTDGVSNLLTSANTDATMIFNGASYITIDGRPGYTGSVAVTELSIKNTSVATGGAAIKFINDAQYNNVYYCNMSAKYCYDNSTTGVVWFADGLTGGSGNSNNIVDHCIIDGTAGAAALPAAHSVSTNGVYSSSSTSTNSNNTLRYNEIKDLYIAQSSENLNRGIFLNSNNSGWTISYNRFYNTTDRTHSTQQAAFTGIEIASGDGYTINYNLMGGKDSTAANKWTVTSSGSVYYNFTAMQLALGTSTVSNIQGNTVKNMTITAYYHGSGFWKGIIVTEGLVNIGTTAANTIGANNVDVTSAPSISYLSASRTAMPTITGMNIASTSTANIQNNVIGGFVTENTAAYTVSFYGIVLSGSGTITASSNTIGSSTQATNINVGGTNVTAVCAFYGISSTCTGVTTISSNTIGNINVYGTGASLAYGIKNTGLMAASSAISSNTITALALQSAGTNTTATITAISNTATADISISNNTITSITLKNGYFTGIIDNAAATGTHTISSNMIGSIATDNINITTAAAGAHYGINIGSTGIYSITNNTVQNITSSGNPGAALSMYGIYLASTGTYTLTANSILNIKNTNTTDWGNVVAGMWFNYSGGYANGSTTVTRNRIVGLENATVRSSAFPSLYGIYYKGYGSGTHNIINNFIYLTNGSNVGSFTIDGFVLNPFGTGPALNVYYNTIYIGGTETGAGNTAFWAYCVEASGSYSALTVKNNIFYNARSSTNNGSRTKVVKYASGTYANNYMWGTSDAAFANDGSNNPVSASTWTSSRATELNNSNSSTITVPTDAAISSAARTIVGLGDDLHSTTNCDKDINNKTRAFVNTVSGGTKGCYEGSDAFYWVGGSGNWSDYTNHWSSTSGGTPNISTVPASSDNVYFDSNSGGGTCTFDAAGNSNNFTASANTALTGAFTLSIYGTLDNSATFTAGTTTIAMTGTAWGITNTGTLTFHHLTIVGTPVTQPSASYTVDGTLTVNSSKTFAPTGGTITMSGASGSIVNSTATDITFYDLTVSGTVSSSGNFNITTGRTMTVSGTFTPAAADVINTSSAVGIITGTGTVKVTRIAATADFSSQYKFATNTLTNLTVEYCGGGAQTCSGLTYGGLKINNASNVAMGGDVTVNKLLNLAVGTLTIGAHALTIASATADQPIRTSGNVDASNASATIAFTNATAITLPASFFTGNVKNFTMNCAGGVTLSDAVIVYGTLTITQGVINLATNSVTLTLGTGTGVLGTLSFTADATYENNKGIYTDNTGSFKRWFASSTVTGVVYPFMAETDYRGAIIDFTVAPTGGSLSMQYILGNPGTNGVTISSSPITEVDGGSGQNIDEVSRDGYWKMTAGTISGGTFNLTVEPKYHMGIQQYNKLTIVNRANATSNWVTFGSRITPTGNSIYDPIIERQGYTSFGEYCLGSRILDNMLSNMAQVTGSNGADGYYTSLTNAGGVFQTLNGANQASQNVVVKIINTYERERGTNALTGSSGMWTSLNMYPSESGLMVSGTYDGPLFNLNGADNVTIDGRVLQAGAMDLILQNISAGSAASTIQFISGATGNTVKYCSIRGSSGTATQGVIMLSTDAAGSGNDNNTISYNTIKKSSEGTIPANGIFSNGTTARENTTITVNNNNFENFSVAGVNVAGYSDNWSIVYNSFYQSASQTPSTTMYFIKVDITAGACTGNSIAGNYFGGQAVTCGSPAGKYTLASSGYPFYGVYMNMLTGSSSTISANYFQNINITSTSASGVSMIYTAGAGGFTIGSLGNANSIGTSTGTNSITTALSSASAPFCGIFNNATGTNTIAYNTMGDIALTTAANGGCFQGINSTAATISNNTIGGSTATNTTIASTATSNYNAGIVLSSTGTYTCNNNVVQNITASGAAAILLYGINLVSTGTYNLSGNVIRTLKYTGTTAVAVKVHGIHATAAPAASVIEKNRISGIENGSTATASELVGIYTTTGNFTHRNNLVIISNNSGTYRYNVILRGIYVMTTTGTNVYNNTVWLSGSDNTAAGTSPQYGSACLDVAAGSGVNIKNNIFKNTRTTTNNKHVTCTVDSYTGKTVDKNYGEAPVAAKYALIGTSNNTSTAWGIAGATNEVDGTAFNITINTDGSVSTADLTNVTVGSNGLGFTTDINGITRTAPPDGYFRGCFEGAPLSYYWVGGAGNWSDYSNHWSFNTGGAPAVASAPTSASNVYFDANSLGTCTIDAAAYANNMTFTGFTGTLAGSQTIDVYGNVLLDAGMTSSYTGILSLRATSGTKTFTSAGKTIGGLTINGTGGTFTPLDNLTLSGNFLCSAGTLDLNGYDISVGGSWTKNGGTFTPGVKKVTFTGTGNIDGSQTTSFYDLYVNSSGTVTMGHDQAITNNLSVSAGTLALGSYTATVTGTTTVAGTMTISTGIADCNGTFNATGGNVTFTGAGNLKLGGATVTSLGTLTSSAGTVWYDRADVQSVLADDYYNLKIDGGAGTKTAQGAVNVNGDLTVNTGATYAIAATTTTVTGISTLPGTTTISTGTLDANGNFDASSGSITFTDAGNLKLSGGTITSLGTLTSTVGSVWYDRAGAQSVLNVPYFNLKIDGSGTKTLADALTINGDLTIAAGTLDDGSDYAIGLAGNWVNSGGTYTARNGTVTFNGSTAQNITSNNHNFYNVTLSNAAGFALQDNATVSNTLTMSTGNVNAGSYTLQLGTGTGNLGTLSYTAGSILGNFKRWFAGATVSNVKFPIGTATYTQMANISYTSAPTGDYLVAKFTSGDPGTNGVTLSSSPINDGGYSVNKICTSGYWTFTAGAGLADGVYTMDLTADHFSGVNEYAKLRLLKRANSSSNWAAVGTFSAGTGSNTTPIVHRTGLTGFCDACVGGNSSDALPVELIRFNAKCNNTENIISWTTASEVNNDYFLLEKSDNITDFAELAIVKGQGNSNAIVNYREIDDTPFETTYYRLKQVDFDGKFTYYGPISLTCIDKTDNYTIYYSNQTDEIIINMQSNRERDLNVMILSTEGKRLINEKRILNEGNNIISISTKQLAIGTYMFIVEMGEKTIAKKFVKNTQ